MGIPSPLFVYHFVYLEDGSNMKNLKNANYISFSEGIVFIKLLKL